MAQGKGADVILLTLNHVIADGRSGIRLLQHILDDAAALVGGEPLMDAEPEDTVADLPLMPVSKRPTSLAKQFPETELHQRQTAVLPIAFDESITKH